MEGMLELDDGTLIPVTPEIKEEIDDKSFEAYIKFLSHFGIILDKKTLLHRREKMRKNDDRQIP